MGLETNGSNEELSKEQLIARLKSAEELANIQHVKLSFVEKFLDDQELNETSEFMQRAFPKYVAQGD